MTVPEIKEIFELEFKNYLQPLKKISRDTNNKVALVDSDKPFHNYDKIAEKIYGGNKPRTPDMIYFKKDMPVFVEFKNGEIGKNLRNEIKVKAIEGAFIVFHRIISKFRKIDFADIFKIDKIYVVVYNAEKNPVANIHNHTYSSEVRFGLGIYEGTFFSRVITIASKEFIQLLKEKGGD